MNIITKSLLGAAIAILASAVLLWIFPLAHTLPLGEQEPAKTPSRVSVQNGETVLTLDSETQSRLGLRVAPLRPISLRENLTVPAVVISVQDLVPLRANYVEAQSRLEKARANAEVTRQEYDRLSVLYKDDQNESQKAQQVAEGASRVDATEVRAASAELDLQATAVRESWGSVVTKWVTNGGPSLERLLAMQELLVEVTLPAGQTAAPPPTISLDLPGSGLAQATLVSQLPRVDPRVQGISFLYGLPARPSLVRGINLVAHLSIGRILQGMIVPESAVVWLEGKAWVYQRTGPNRLTRRAVATDMPASKGYFVAQGVLPGDQVVVRGAQLLLSEESRPQVPSGGGGDTD